MRFPRIALRRRSRVLVALRGALSAVLWAVLWVALTLVGCASSTDHLVARNWHAACEAVGDDDRGRVLGWMWASGDLTFQGRVWTADEVSAAFGAMPHEYGDRFALVELELATTGDDVVLRGVAGESDLRATRQRASALLEGRTPPPDRPRLPPGPHRDAPADPAEHLKLVVEPLIAGFAGEVLLPVEVALTLPTDGVVQPFSLFQPLPDRGTRSGVFDDALLDDAEWTAIARVRADDYVARLAAWTRDRAARARGVEVLAQRMLDSRRCEASSKKACTLLAIVDRSADEGLAVELDGELDDSGPGCWPSRRFVGELPSDQSLLQAAHTAAGQLRPAAKPLATP